MDVKKCSECGQDLARDAILCIKCGHPMSDTAVPLSKTDQMWNAVIKARTPINIFALAMMACAAVLGVSAVHVDNCHARIAFTYTLHAFMAVAGMFFLTLLFVKRGLYHPEDLNKVNPAILEKFGRERSGIAAAIIVVMLFGYAIYQFEKKPNCIDEIAAAHGQATTKQNDKNTTPQGTQQSKPTENTSSK